MSRPASRVDRDEHRYESRADHADDIAEARAEAMAERAWDDDGDYEISRAEDRYLTGFGWDK